MPTKDLTYFESLVRFMAEMHGPDCEIILYNVETRKVHCVEHPFDEEMKPGSEMRSLEKSFLERKDYEREDYIVNYRALSRTKEKLKSATLFLKNQAGELLAILTINQKVERLIELRNIIDTMISGARPPKQELPSKNFYESFDISVPEIVTKTIHEEVSALRVEPTRLDAKEKMQLVHVLDDKGIFLVKGAVAELASILGTTETTIYRYINRLNEDEAR